MRPKRLSLCAWGPYPKREEIDFTAFDDRGIFLITGATGAGKTTVFDAISYALYGALSGDERDKERGSVRSDFADAQTPTYVELVMEHGGQVYEIRRNPEYFRPRKRRSAKTELQVSGEPEKEGVNPGEKAVDKISEKVVTLPLTKEKENAILTYPDGRVLEGVREVNSALQELLGLDYQQFKKISMIAQGEFARLLVAPPREKTKIFRELFGTGIYERFTQGLSARSKRLYAKVMEHKAKLSEDVRLLAVDMEKRGWDEELCGEFERIITAENWNYEELTDCLKKMERKASEAVNLQKKQYGCADKEVERLTAALSAQEQINQNIEQLQEISATRLRLQEQEEVYLEKEKCVTDAGNAGFVEGAEEKLTLLLRQLEQNQAEKRRTEDERKALLAEAEQLAETVAQAAHIRELLNEKKALQELESECQKLEKDIVRRREELQAGRENYLTEEAVCRQARMRYEEAERGRRLAAIGLAAALLEPGKPCPVCGSLEHPAPATTEEEIVSEEELNVLREDMEAKNEVVNSLHESLIALKAQVEGLAVQADRTKAKLAGRQEMLSEEKNPVCRTYLEQEPEQAAVLLQERCDRAGQIAGFLQEKKDYGKRLMLQTEQLQQELKEAEKLLKRLLHQYGFADREAYEQAKLPAKEREALQRDIASYKERVAANGELYLHLQEATQGKEYVNLQEQTEQLCEVRGCRDAALKEQKRWEQNLSEVIKTDKLIREKLSHIEEAGKEYGYIKDLENMAVGNNARKLVFEQYVLAGYFEEILRAANIRFRKMTAGRYEMERVSEVGDGRVKDSLEIQVLDYYTGKYRSVRTLSGGESFKASLALALGLSDVIQSMNGGIRVDTLFVDEGFGALDEESLNQACDTLMALVEKNRLIGIISHVPELRERIDRQLIIDKTGSGSSIRNGVQ